MIYTTRRERSAKSSTSTVFAKNGLTPTLSQNGKKLGTKIYAAFSAFSLILTLGQCASAEFLNQSWKKESWYSARTQDAEDVQQVINLKNRN